MGWKAPPAIVGPVDIGGRNMTGGGLQVYLDFEVPPDWMIDAGRF